MATRLKLAASTMAAMLCGSPAVSEDVTYRYDARGRLVAVERPNASGTTYTLDAADNRLRRWNGTGTPPAQPAPPPAPPVPQPFAPPAFSISDASAGEAGVLTFTVTKTGETDQTFTIGYSTADESAAQGSDFAGRSGTLTFGPAQQFLRVPVFTINDNIFEQPETFGIVLDALGSAAALADPRGQGTIADDDMAQASGPPVAGPDSFSMSRCGTRTFNLVANDYDPEGHEPVTLVAVSGGRLGEASKVSDTSITYSGYGNAGTEGLTYTIRDSLGAIATGVVSITLGNGFCPIEN